MIYSFYRPSENRRLSVYNITCENNSTAHFCIITDRQLDHAGNCSVVANDISVKGGATENGHCMAITTLDVLRPLVTLSASTFCTKYVQVIVVVVVVAVVNGSYSAAPYSSSDRECITKSQLIKIKHRQST